MGRAYPDQRDALIHGLRKAKADPRSLKLTRGQRRHILNFNVRPTWLCRTFGHPFVASLEHRCTRCGHVTDLPRSGASSSVEPDGIPAEGDGR